MTDPKPTPWWAYAMAGLVMVCAAVVIVAFTVAAVRAALH